MRSFVICACVTKSSTPLC